MIRVVLLYNKRNTLNIKYLGADFLISTEQALSRKIPSALFDKFRDLSFGKRQLSYFIISRLYSKSFESVPLSQAYIIQYGFCPKVFTAVKRELRERGIIELTQEADHNTRRCEHYRINPFLVADIYPVSHLFYPDFDRANKRICRQYQKINVLDPVVREYLKKLNFHWNGDCALKLLSSLPLEDQQKYWKHICYIPSKSIVHSNWYQVIKTGRLYASNPAIQNIPGIFRLQEIICLNESWEVDFTAQHFNILLSFNGLPPLEQPWQILEEITGLPKQVVKGIINPMCEGQHKGQHIYIHDYDPLAGIQFDRVREALKKLGIRHFPAPLQLQSIGGRIFSNILHELSDNNIDLRLPLHDGVIIAGSQVDADKTIDAFHKASYDIIRHELPVKIDKVPC